MLLAYPYAEIHARREIRFVAHGEICCFLPERRVNRLIQFTRSL
jgi:hypothetical protein